MVSEPVLARTLLTDTYAVQSVGPPEKKWMDFFSNLYTYRNTRPTSGTPGRQTSITRTTKTPCCGLTRVTPLLVSPVIL